MKETVMSVLTSYYTWIAVELIVIAVLVFFVLKYSRRKKIRKQDIEKRELAFRYKELDEMLANKKRNRR